MMIDATKSLEQKKLLEIELDAVGIRLNKSKPDGTSSDETCFIGTQSYTGLFHLL